MAKKSSKFKCVNCGYETIKYMGRCTNCGKFGTLEEVVEDTIKKQHENSIRGVDNSKALNKVSSTLSNRLITGISEFDRVLGGGLVEDSISIISAPPGTGKSTLLLQVCSSLAEQGLSVLYATGEESENQVKRRADRILDNISDNIKIVSDNCMDNVITSIEKSDAKFIIIDSIQAMALSTIASKIGSPTQVIGCANELTKMAKNNENPRCIIIICQMTKEDELSGPRTLEHLVDTVLILDGTDELKSLSSTKNRFGELDTGFFTMTGDKGLEEVSNPSQFFMTEREVGEEVSGSALCVVREGIRPILLEIESSTSKSYAPYPSRLAEGFRKDQLNILVSILEQRAGINLWNENVIVRTTGAMKINETSVNLAILMSIASSYYKKPIPNKTIFIGEVGLTGELKKVVALESRIKEAERMGFERVIVPNQNIRLDLDFLNIKVIKQKTIKSTIQYIWQ